MTMENYGKVWATSIMYKPISTFNLLDENEMKKCFNWLNTKTYVCEGR